MFAPRAERAVAPSVGERGEGCVGERGGDESGRLFGEGGPDSGEDERSLNWWRRRRRCLMTTARVWLSVAAVVTAVAAMVAGATVGTWAGLGGEGSGGEATAAREVAVKAEEARAAVARRRKEGGYDGGG